MLVLSCVPGESEARGTVPPISAGCGFSRALHASGGDFPMHAVIQPWSLFAYTLACYSLDPGSYLVVICNSTEVDWHMLLKFGC